MTDYEMIASNLYDGGWRAKDKKELIEEYELTEEEAENICAMLENYEEEKE